MKKSPLFTVSVILILIGILTGCKNFFSGSDKKKNNNTTDEEVTEEITDPNALQLKTGPAIRVIFEQIVPRSITGIIVDSPTATFHGLEARRFQRATSRNKDAEFYLDVAEKDVPVWYDSDTKTLYYFIGENQTLLLNPNSSYMFAGFVNLNVLETTYFNTSKVTNMRGMFTWCSEILNIDVSNFDTSKVTDMSHMFSNCKTMSSLDVGSFRTQNVTNMSSMFEGCGGLCGTLNLHGFNTAKVTDMSFMFFYCTNLTSLDLSTFNTSKVTNMKYMFAFCKSMTNLDLYKFNTSKVTDVSFMLSNCNNLISIDLCRFDVSHITNMTGMFQDSTNLQYIYVNGGTNWASSSLISTDMFKNCHYLPNFSASSLDASRAHIGDDGSGYFLLSTKILKLKTGLEIQQIFDQVLSATDPITINSRDFNKKYFRHFKRASAPVSNSGYYLDIAETSVPVWYDEDAETLYYFIQEYQILELNEDSSYMFTACESVQDIETTYMDTSLVTDMAYMFYYCKALGTLDISVFNTSSVTNMSNMFGFCAYITSYDFSHTSVSQVTDMNYMFFGNTALTSVNLSAQNVSGLTNAAGMFMSCRNLSDLNLDGFTAPALSDTNRMFYDCPKLTYLDLYGFGTGNVSDMSEMFRGCYSLEEIDISSAWSTASVSNGSNMFANCSKLPNFNTSQTGVENAHSGLRNGRMGYLNLATNFPLKSSSEIYVIFDSFCGAPSALYEACNDSAGVSHNGIDATAFVKASERNADATQYLDIKNKNVPVWYDMGTRTIYYYIDDGCSLRLNSDSSALFANCYAMTTIQTSDFDTSSVTDMSNMFWNCASLESIDLSNFETANVTTMAGLFKGCVRLDTLDLQGFDTAKVTKMSDMFNGCSSVEELDLQAFDTAAVKEMKNMFKDCQSLEDLNISSFIATAVTNMESMFENCSSLAAIDVNHLKTRAVVYLNRMFAGCESLTEMNLCEFNTPLVRYMKEMFAGCSQLQKLYLYNFETKVATNMSNMFKDCGNLEYIYVQPGTNWNKSGLNSEDMFAGCTRLTGASGGLDAAYANAGATGYFRLQSVELKSGSDIHSLLESVGGTARYFSASVDAPGFVVTDFLDTGRPSQNEDPEIPVWYESSEDTVYFYNPYGKTLNLPSDSSGMFAGLGFEKIDFRYFDSSSVQDMHDMFKNCSSLKEVVVPHFYTPNVTDMSSMFEGCSDLATVGLDNIDVGNVLSTERMFYGCQTLRKLNLPENYRNSSVTTVKEMFKNCYQIPRIILNGLITEKTTDMESLFDGCRTLQVLEIENIDTQNVTNMKNVFAECANLTNLELSSFDTSKVTTMEGMFFGCAKLQTVNVLTFNTKNVLSMKKMFAGCEMLETLGLYSFETESVTNMDEMFANSSRLTYIHVREGTDWYKPGLSSIDMFEKCTSLRNYSGYNTAEYANTNQTSPAGYFHTGKLRIMNNTNNNGELRKIIPESVTAKHFKRSFKQPKGTTPFLDNGKDVSVWYDDTTETVYYYIKPDELLRFDTDAQFFFNGTGFEDIETTYFDTSNVLNMAGFFNECSHLQSLDLRSFDTRNVECMDELFFGCIALTDVNLTSFDLSHTIAMNGMFVNCQSLTTLDLHSFIPINVTHCASMFDGCINLEVIYVLDNTNWKSPSVSNSTNMFRNCNKLPYKGADIQAAHVGDGGNFTALP